MTLLTQKPPLFICISKIHRKLSEIEEGSGPLPVHLRDQRGVQRLQDLTLLNVKTTGDDDEEGSDSATDARHREVHVSPTPPRRSATAAPDTESSSSSGSGSQEDDLSERVTNELRAFYRKRSLPAKVEKAASLVNAAGKNPRVLLTALLKYVSPLLEMIDNPKYQPCGRRKVRGIWVLITQ